MTDKEIGIDIAHKLINYNNINKENYLPLVDKFLKEYKLNKNNNKCHIINSMIHELSVLGYEIIETHPFKLNKS